MPASVAWVLATGCDASVELSVGAGRQAAAHHALQTALGPEVPVVPGPAGGLRVPVAHADAGRAVLLELGLDRRRPPEPPRLVLGPTEAAAYGRRRAGVALETALLRRPGVIAAEAHAGTGAAAVTVWHLPDAAPGVATGACAFARHMLGPETLCEPRPLESRSGPVPGAPGTTEDGRRELTIWASAACLLLSATLAGLAWRARRSERPA